MHIVYIQYVNVYYMYMYTYSYLLLLLLLLLLLYLCVVKSIFKYICFIYFLIYLFLLGTTLRTALVR